MVIFKLNSIIQSLYSINMKTIKLQQSLLAICTLALCLFTIPLNAQLDKTFTNIFNEILGDSDEEGALTPVLFEFGPPGNRMTGNHGAHFKPAANSADSILAPALNQLISGNVSSFPLSATSAGVTFDFSSGEPVSIKESLGPIFAETGRTLGKNKLNVGMNFSHLNLANFRGLRTEDIRFTFTHEDSRDPGLGDLTSESDVIDVFLDLHLNANIFAFYATYGILKNLDIGIALPVINVGMHGDAKAVVRSFTHSHDGEALHHFGETGTEIDGPDLDHITSYDESSFGIGDLTLRLKYSFSDQSTVDFAGLVDVRLPTGKEEDFLGTGETNIRFMGIISKKINQFTPHLNLGYDYRPGDYDSDEFEYALGFDQKIIKGLTLAVDFLGEIDLKEEETLNFDYSAEPLVINDHVTHVDEDENGNIVETEGILTRTIEQTNIPRRDNDSVHNFAFGLRFAPTNSNVLLANILLPLNTGGLRSSVAFTLGFSASF